MQSIDGDQVFQSGHIDMSHANTQRDSLTTTLYALPYAGGDDWSYSGLSRHLTFVDLQTLSLPGRGRRLSEPALLDPETIVADLLRRIDLNGKRPYALYGHSLGARLGFLLCQTLRERNLPLPVHLFVSGEVGPSRIECKSSIWQLPSQAFWTHLKKLGGIPEEILSHKDLLAFFEGVLRADFEVLSKIEYRALTPLNLPITVLTGDSESLADDAIRSWQAETSLPLRHIKLSGDHFFIRSHWRELAAFIEQGIATSTTLSSATA